MATSVLKQWRVAALLAFLLGLLFSRLTQVQAIKPEVSRDAGDYPEAVLISARNTHNQRTGRASGALVAPRVVLTAAHCVAGFDSWEVRAPYTKPTPATAVSKTAKVYPKNKEGAFENDLAVLLLETGIDLGGKYPTLHGGDLFPIGTKLVVLGSTHNGPPSQTKLYQMPVALVSFPDNINVYGGNPQVVERGDSGGPVYVADKDHEIAAVVSGHIGLSQRFVATDLYVPLHGKNREWVLQQIRKTPSDSRQPKSAFRDPQPSPIE
jgi:hypothetical protein